MAPLEPKRTPSPGPSPAIQVDHSDVELKALPVQINASIACLDAGSGHKPIGFRMFLIQPVVIGSIVFLCCDGTRSIAQSWEPCHFASPPLALP